MMHFTTEIFQLANGKGMIKCHHFATTDEIMHPGNGPPRLIQEKNRDEHIPRYILNLLMEVHVPSMNYPCQKELSLV